MNYPAAPVPALVLGHSPTGLYAIRELGRAGVPVFSCGEGGSATRSKYLTFGPKCIIQSDEAARLKALVTAGQLGGGAKFPLFATSDQDVDFVMRHSKILSKHYTFQKSFDDGIAAKVLNKESFYDLCRNNGIDVPRSWDVDRRNVAALESEVPYPCLIKPSLIHAVKKSMAGRKLWTVETREEFKTIARNLPEGDTSWLVQEIIPGPESEILLFCAYFDTTGKAHQPFTARKLRQFPPGFGSASLTISEAVEDIRRVSIALMQAIQYRGIAATEFKRDPRDGRLKVIESNPRPSLWFGNSSAAGKKIVLTAYCDMAGINLPEDSRQREGVLWQYGLKDLYSRLFYWRNRDFILPAPVLPEKGGVAPRVWAVFARDDQGPVLSEIANMARKALNRLGLRI
jgi:D-aspartate ligase